MKKKRDKAWKDNLKRPFSFWIKYIFGIGSLPDYLIIGSIKGGTTSLYKYLTMHSKVAPAFTKELRFFYNDFNGNFDLGKRWYKANFLSIKKRISLVRLQGKHHLGIYMTP